MDQWGFENWWVDGCGLKNEWMMDVWFEEWMGGCGLENGCGLRNGWVVGWWVDVVLENGCDLGKGWWIDVVWRMDEWMDVV